MKQFPNKKIGHELSVQIRTPNFKFIVTRFPWKKVEKNSLNYLSKISKCHINVCYSGRSILP